MWGMIFPGNEHFPGCPHCTGVAASGISIDAPRRIIGKNTIECMKSGVIYSNAAALDGIVERIEKKERNLGRNPL